MNRAVNAARVPSVFRRPFTGRRAPRVQTHGLQRAGALDRHMGVAFGNRSSAYAAEGGWGRLGFTPTKATHVAAGGGGGPTASPCATGNFSLAAATFPETGTFICAPDESAMYQLRRAGVFGGAPQLSATVQGLTSMAGR